MQALPTKLDTAQALSLATEIKADLEQNRWVHLNGKSVEMVGQACLQILLSARLTAEKARLPFLIEDPRLRTHSQNKTVAARQIAEKKTVGHLS